MKDESAQELNSDIVECHIENRREKYLDRDPVK
jgi:hypothetical protein